MSQARRRNCGRRGGGSAGNQPARRRLTTKVGDVTYTVTIDADGKGSVFGKYLEENKVAFGHTPIITPKGDDDPKNPKEEDFNKMVTNLNNDGDLAGSTFGLLKARGVSKGNKKILPKKDCHMARRGSGMAMLAEAAWRESAARNWVRG